MVSFVTTFLTDFVVILHAVLGVDFVIGLLLVVAAFGWLYAILCCSSM